MTVHFSGQSRVCHMNWMLTAIQSLATGVINNKGFMKVKQRTFHYILMLMSFL